MKKYPVVTLCGSTRFKNEFMQVQKELTLKGNIVISVGLFGHAGDMEVWEDQDEDSITKTKIMLDDMHKEKIRMAESIYVVNPGGYIGSSTWSEICYAKMLQKRIESLCPIDEWVIEEKVKARIQKAEILAWEQLDGIRHSNGYFDINDYVHFTHKHKNVLDPWISLEAHYDGRPWTYHDDPSCAVDPFEYYGREKVAGFIEEILMKYGAMNEVKNKEFTTDKELQQKNYY